MPIEWAYMSHIGPWPIDAFRNTLSLSSESRAMVSSVCANCLCWRDSRSIIVVLQVLVHETLLCLVDLTQKPERIQNRFNGRDTDQMQTLMP